LLISFSGGFLFALQELLIVDSWVLFFGAFGTVTNLGCFNLFAFKLCGQGSQLS